MSEQIKIAHFDRGKPFYPLVMQYVAQLVGFHDLLARDFLGPQDIEKAMENYVSTYIKQPKKSPAWMEAMEKAKKTPAWMETSKSMIKLLGPLELRASTHAKTLKVPIDEIAKELVANHRFLMNYLLLSAGSVLMLAHEICKEKPAHDTGPLWEFLRHCRNAAGHGGKFYFKHGEPRRLAKWESLDIVPELQNMPLFKGEDGIGFLSPADPILLLWDIEQAYPELS